LARRRAEASVRSIFADRLTHAEAAPPPRIRVAFADDAFLMRQAINRVLEDLPQIEIVAECADGDALLTAIAREQPDVVLTDIRMPPSGDDEGIRIARLLRRTHPQVGVVVLSQLVEPRYGVDLFADGAEGRAYLLKDRVSEPRELLTAVEVVASGGSLIDPVMVGLLVAAGERRHEPLLAALTPREKQVLAEMAKGASNATIADTLVLSKRAVEKYVGGIFAKLGLPNEHEVSRRVCAVLVLLSEEPLRSPSRAAVTPAE
jgi:DNA-binding NarL/FixJ family response regulator